MAMSSGEQKQPRWAIEQDMRDWQMSRKTFGNAVLDPLFLQVIDRDGEPVILGRCPGCGSWCDLDLDQFNGKVSTHHDVPECGWHEMKDWWVDHVA